MFLFSQPCRYPGAPTQTDQCVHTSGFEQEHYPRSLPERGWKRGSKLKWGEKQEDISNCHLVDQNLYSSSDIMLKTIDEIQAVITNTKLLFLTQNWDSTRTILLLCFWALNSSCLWSLMLLWTCYNGYILIIYEWWQYCSLSGSYCFIFSLFYTK